MKAKPLGRPVCNNNQCLCLHYHDFTEFYLFQALTRQLTTLQIYVALWESWFVCVCVCVCVCVWVKLQALVYDTLPSTTAVFSYATGSWQLSANEQFFIGAQKVVSLLQTTEIKQGMSLAAANKVYTSANKTTFVWIEMELLFFTRGGCVSCLHGCLAASTVTLVPKPFGRRWQRRWTAARR